MTYELAKQLKDGGFPMDKYGQCSHCGSFESPYPGPSLSELILACGDGFRRLVFERGAAKRRWAAWGIGGSETYQLGETPEEAVAKLWLELNKKQ